jgi:hypothetical protein
MMEDESVEERRERDVLTRKSQARVRYNRRNEERRKVCCQGKTDLDKRECNREMRSNFGRVLGKYVSRTLSSVERLNQGLNRSKTERAIEQNDQDVTKEIDVGFEARSVWKGERKKRG